MTTIWLNDILWSVILIIVIELPLKLSTSKRLHLPRVLDLALMEKNQP
jgi:hypothetical protein